MSARRVMAERRKGRAPRGYAASRFDEVTLALLFVLSLAAVGAALSLGPAEVLDRVGCGLNDTVNGLLAHPRPCR